MPEKNQNNFILKLKALLHDPVHKIWAMGNQNIRLEHENQISPNIRWHEKIAEDLFRFILSENLKDDKVQKADELASAISRIVVAPDIQNKNDDENASAVFLNDAKYIEPFSDKPISENTSKIDCPASHDEVKDFFKRLGEMDFLSQEERARLSFLFLWRFLPEVFKWIDKHPADSRAPNHSIYDHLVQTAAIATCLDVDKPAFLIFTITPVQSFIVTARKTSDLWAGSYLLSYLIYKAIEVIMENYGPDNIIFPNLLGQPLVDRWLGGKFKDKFQIFEQDWYKRFKENSTSDEKLTIANFPNRFLAIVPYKEAKDIAENCQKAIEKTISNLLEKIPEDLKSILSQKKDNIKNNIASYLKTYWVVLPWYKDKDNYTNIDAVINEYEKLVGKNNLLEAIHIIKSHPYYGTANAGNAYSLLVELTERFLAARKMIKDFVLIEPQKGEKCHLCGEYDILPLTNDEWKNLIDKHYVSKSERLCGVCLFKRFLPEMIQKELGLSDKVQFPSTSEIATVSYKSKLADNLIDKFINKYNIIFSDGNPSQIKSVPALKNYKTDTNDEQFQNITEHKLYTIDGQWLMESSYRKEYLENEFGIIIEESKLEGMKKFLKDNKITPPNYYAILAMDGDNMGKWLKGEFLPEIGKLIHEKAQKSLLDYSTGNDRQELETLLRMKHPMLPSFHNLFSRKLSEFALNKVREIVEDDHYGKLIYAGGDDVLTFLPVDTALGCACELNNKFKTLLGNNQNASMSAGIVFVHHKYPLELALDEVRDAEKKAKYKYGRNAVCIKYIAGGGQARHFGMNWDDKTFFDDIISKYSKDELSTKFAYDFMDIVNSVGYTENGSNDNLKQILKNELLRIYRHKKLGEKEDNFEGKMLEHFDKMSPQDFANMFIIARFVAQIKG
jgi:CRISPR-associated protein Cmr2